MERNLKIQLPEDAIFLGQITEGRVVIAVAFSHYCEHDIHVSLVVRGHGSKGLIREVFNYIFVKAGCARCTCLIRKSNTRSIRLAEKLGFKKEGVLRKYYGDEDAFVYGLLKEECYGVCRQTPEGS